MLAGALAPGLATSAPAGQDVMQGFPPAPELRVSRALLGGKAGEPLVETGHPAFSLGFAFLSCIDRM